MNRIAWAFAALSATFVVSAQQPPAKPRDPGYGPLQHFVGSWTVKGSEDTYREVCDWYDGRFHVVCNTESRRDDGSTGRSMSILGYVPAQGYAYAGIGSGGHFQTHRHGTFEGGVFEFVDTVEESGRRRIKRTRMGPFDSTEVPFVVDTSIDGGPWTVDVDITYLRLD